MSAIPRDSDAAISRSAIPEPNAITQSQNRPARILTLDRAGRQSAPVSINPLVRGLLERAVVEASNRWSASDPEAAASNAAYEALSALAEAVIQVLGGGHPELRAATRNGSIREPLDRLRRALLDESANGVDRVRFENIVTALRALEQVHEVSQCEASRRFTEDLASGNALELVVGVAHDMRSPLSSILFLVETLRNAYRGKSTPVEERQLGLVYGASLGLSQLVSDVIELARGCDRLIDRKPIPFSVSELLNSVLRVVQPIAEEKRLALYMELPEVDARVGYPAALSRVMLNLVTNALKFTQEGYVEITSRQISRTSVEFAVRDTGPGIPDDELATLYRALRRRQRSKGHVLSSSGLGLAICQQLVTAMGSDLQVETQVGRETRFHFVLDLPPATKM